MKSRISFTFAIIQSRLASPISGIEVNAMFDQKLHHFIQRRAPFFAEEIDLCRVFRHERLMSWNFACVAFGILVGLQVANVSHQG